MTKSNVKLVKKVDSRRKGFSIVKNTYFRPNGTINKPAIIISAVVVLLMLIMGFYLNQTTVKKSTFDSEVVTSLSSGAAQEAVATAFLNGIEEYNNGNTDYESQRQAILKMLVEMLKADGGFTNDQKDAIEEVITEYLNTNEVYGTVEENTGTIEGISQILNKTSNKNKEYAASVKKSLKTLIDASNNKSDERYKEITKLIEDINQYIDGQEVSYEELFEKINQTVTNNSENINYLLDNTTGASTWDSNAIYSKGDFVLYDNRLYMSLKDGNNSTLGDTSSWVRTDFETIIKEKTRDIESLETVLKEMIYNSNSQAEANNEELTNSINGLKISSASSLEDVNKQLTDLIKNNADLSAEKRQELLDIINANESTSKESLEELYNKLTTALGEQNTALTGQISALKQSTATDMDTLSKNVHQSIVNLDTKYSVYYEKEFSTSIDMSSGLASVTINSASIKPTSDINIIYDSSSRSGYTAEYQQNDGSLVITLTANSKGAPSSLSGTIYVDNSMDNAQKESNE